jgi:hypothetical protein
VLWGRLDTDGDRAGIELIGVSRFDIASEKNGFVHEVLCVARREITRQRPEEIELLTVAIASRRGLAPPLNDGCIRPALGRSRGGWAGSTVLRGSDVEVTAPRSAQALISRA